MDLLIFALVAAVGGIIGALATYSPAYQRGSAAGYDEARKSLADFRQRLHDHIVQRVDELHGELKDLTYFVLTFKDKLGVLFQRVLGLGDNRNGFPAWVRGLAAKGCKFLSLHEYTRDRDQMVALFQVVFMETDEGNQLFCPSMLPRAQLIDLLDRDLRHQAGTSVRTMATSMLANPEVERTLDQLRDMMSTPPPAAHPEEAEQPKATIIDRGQGPTHTLLMPGNEHRFCTAWGTPLGAKEQEAGRVTCSTC